MTSLMETCPQQTMRSLGGALHSLITSPLLSASADVWMGQAVCALEASIVAKGIPDRIGPEGWRQFINLSVARRPALPRGRYEALVLDMAAWSRGDEGREALLAYEM